MRIIVALVQKDALQDSDVTKINKLTRDSNKIDCTNENSCNNVSFIELDYLNKVASDKRGNKFTIILIVQKEGVTASRSMHAISARNYSENSSRQSIAKMLSLKIKIHLLSCLSCVF